MAEQIKRNNSERAQEKLEKAQSRYNKVSSHSKEFKLEFSRSMNKSGKFVTKPNIVRGEKEYHFKGYGLLHSIDYAAKYRVKGIRFSSSHDSDK